VPSLRGLAMLYACGVVLAAPVTLHADDVKATPDETEATETTETAPPAPASPPSAPTPAPAPAPAAPPPTAPAPAPPPAQPEPASTPRATAAASGSVQMRDFSFSPATITVNVGDSVTWVNSGEEPHNAVGDGFSTALLDAGESASESFSSAGTFSYICTVHPQMKGTVKVVGAAAQTEDGTDDAGTPSSGNAGAGDADTTPDETTGPRLADSGLDAWLLALAGIAMLAAGLALRDRLARID
jgi:plastocyanin